MSASLSAAVSGAKDPSPGEQVRQEFHTATGRIKFWLWLPKRPPFAGSPLMLFLHGAGERGDDLKLVKKHGPPRLVEANKDLQPFILISPQCPKERSWNIDQLKELVDALAEKYRADKSRLYITGLSMGGFATWEMTAKYPDLFAAAIPICGGGNPKDAEKVKRIPFRVYHGAKDEAVPVHRSQQMVDALKKAGARDVEIEIFPDIAHESWTPVYANPQTYAWLLKQRKR
ncbi:MAG: prolyl oligopeptidase family serine peptidase [Verrucomicrobiales bacterium]